MSYIQFPNTAPPEQYTRATPPSSTSLQYSTPENIFQRPIQQRVAPNSHPETPPETLDLDAPLSDPILPILLFLLLILLNKLTKNKILQSLAHLKKKH